jgi:hypothetical protein
MGLDLPKKTSRLDRNWLAVGRSAQRRDASSDFIQSDLIRSEKQRYISMKTKKEPKSTSPLVQSQMSRPCTQNVCVQQKDDTNMSKHSSCMNIRVFLSIGVFLLLFLTSCSTPVRNITSHHTYNYATFVGPAPGPVHPGDQLTLTWKPSPGQDSNEATPTPITLDAVLFGPFSSPTAVHDAEESQPSCPVVFRNVVAKITPIQTNDWTNTTYTSTLLLPQNMSVGYYAYLQKANLNGNSSCAWGANMVVVEAK